MSFTSYARNFEDVMLNRVFSDIENGFFVDVGAFHPFHDSTTYALYRRGWRGVAIEPSSTYSKLWPIGRPEDVFLNVAAGATNGTTTFFSMPDAGQGATTVASVAQNYKDKGLKIVEVEVPMVTLNDVLAQYRPTDPIHCLSVDVEEGERAVLEGLNLQRFRPWLIMLESVEPGTPTPNHAAWEPVLVQQGYEFVYFDGINRFYLAHEHAQRKVHFTYPPCVWDNFTDVRLVAAHKQLEKALTDLAALKQQLQHIVDKM